MPAKYFSHLIFLIVGLLVGSGTAYHAEAGMTGFENRVVTGAFVQINSANALNGTKWWKDQVKQMAGLGMDVIVIQYAGLDKIVFYSQSQSFAKTLYRIGNGTNDHNPIRAILQEAEVRKVKVYLGIHHSSSFDTYLTTGGRQGSEIVQITIDHAKKSLDDLYHVYGWDAKANGGKGAAKYESLAGWYFPQEINNYVALTASEWKHDREIINYTKQLADHAKRTTPLKTMVSPFFNLNQAMKHKGQTYADWWRDEALNTKTGGFDVDIIAMQDGVGAGIIGHSDSGIQRHATVLTAPAEFAKIKKAISKYRATLWANVEAFDQTTAYGITQTGFRRFRNQITSLAPFVEKTILFDYPHHLASNAMTPQFLGTKTIPSERQNLFIKYQQYVKAEKSRIRIQSYSYSNKTTQTFHHQADDPDKTLLADLSTGAITIAPKSSAFINGTWVGFDKLKHQNNNTASVILFNLNKEQAVGRIELFFLQDATASIFSPGTQAITVRAGRQKNGRIVYFKMTPTNVKENFEVGESGVKLSRIVLNFHKKKAQFFEIKIVTTNRFVFLGEVAFYANH